MLSAMYPILEYIKNADELLNAQSGLASIVFISSLLQPESFLIHFLAASAFFLDDISVLAKYSQLSNALSLSS